MTRPAPEVFASSRDIAVGLPSGTIGYNPSQANSMNEQHQSVEPAPRRHRPSRLRNLAWGILLGSLAGIVLSLVVLAVVRREPLPRIGFEELDAAAERWAANGPASYDMDLELTGINPGMAHVEVRDAKVTAMTLNGRPTKQHLWDDWAVPGLFAIIRRDLESCLAPNSKTETRNLKPETAQPVYPHGLFDRRYGYPAQYHRITPTGADAQWQVTKFAPQ